MELRTLACSGPAQGRAPLCQRAPAVAAAACAGVRRSRIRILSPWCSFSGMREGGAVSARASQRRRCALRAACGTVGSPPACRLPTFQRQVLGGEASVACGEGFPGRPPPEWKTVPAAAPHVIPSPISLRLPAAQGLE